MVDQQSNMDRLSVYYAMHPAAVELLTTVHLAERELRIHAWPDIFQRHLLGDGSSVQSRVIKLFLSDIHDDGSCPRCTENAAAQCLNHFRLLKTAVEACNGLAMARYPATYVDPQRHFKAASSK